MRPEVFHGLSYSQNLEAGVDCVYNAQGLYQRTRRPFGLAQAGAAYSQYVSLVLSGSEPQGEVHYLDDGILHHRGLRDHIGQSWTWF